MALAKTWYSVEEAASKYGVTREAILQWVEEGVVRSEGEGKHVKLVNGDDLDLIVEERAFRA